jgi:hypothetical protein
MASIPPWSPPGGDAPMADRVGNAYFSLLRWRADATKDEARNVAVLLLDEQGDLGVIRHAPISSISQRLRDQGILDEILLGLEERLASEPTLKLEDVRELSSSLQRALVITEPKPVHVTNLDESLDALYRAYVAPAPTGGSRAPTKGVVLDRVVDMLRKRGVRARRGGYVDDFIFDVVLENGEKPAVLEVLSFAAPRKDWTPVERDAGHFLYAVRTLELPGRGVVQPPSEQVGKVESYERILRWFDREDVPVVEPTELADTQLLLEPVGR